MGWLLAERFLRSVEVFDMNEWYDVEHRMAKTFLRLCELRLDQISGPSCVSHLSSRQLKQAMMRYVLRIIARPVASDCSGVPRACCHAARGVLNANLKNGLTTPPAFEKMYGVDLHFREVF